MSLEQYEAMVEAGVFTERDRFHLINGVLVAKMTPNSPHATADLLCRDALMAIAPDGWHVRSGGLSMAKMARRLVEEWTAKRTASAK